MNKPTASIYDFFPNEDYTTSFQSICTPVRCVGLFVLYIPIRMHVFNTMHCLIVKSVLMKFWRHPGKKKPIDAPQDWIWNLVFNLTLIFEEEIYINIFSGVVKASEKRKHSVIIIKKIRYYLTYYYVLVLGFFITIFRYYFVKSLNVCFHLLHSSLIYYFIMKFQIVCKNLFKLRFVYQIRRSVETLRGW